uniref:heme ABC transporter permease/ATP-binding protein CydD n=1 Tax=Thaumasiovibrio occultus TaxID=1891184 RepID=UPI000B358EA8|nr:cysteine/glutathione ABC transporter permease/ATP-binding protein CydD [Thaumasiovibrio occultus]
MDRLTQRALSKWLKQQSKPAKRWLSLAILSGTGAGVMLIIQAALLAHILHQLIITGVERDTLLLSFVGLVIASIGRAGFSWLREYTGYRCGELVRQNLRELVLARLNQLGPAYIKGRPAGAWSSLLLEQIEEMQDFFARYLPQMMIAVTIPILILVVVFPQNWAAGVIFLVTAPLVPMFMALVGMGAADANKRNFKALQRLSGHFLDRLRGMPTLRLFNYAEKEADNLYVAAHVLRKRTMEVLRLAFLSSAVLEFFAAISVAIVAVYFGFTYIGELNFGHYGTSVTLFTGLFVLILAPEFYQPLRELGTYYHARAQAIASAESLVDFLDSTPDITLGGTSQPDLTTLRIEANELEVYALDGSLLVGPVSFTINNGERVAFVGHSGAGKTSILNALLGFLPYKGSLQVNGIELQDMDLAYWRRHLSWVGQNPLLLHGTVAENIALGEPNANEQAIQEAAQQAYAAEFINELPHGYATKVGDRSSGLSVGQAQRVALARAILQQGQFWLLDEPTASLDASSEATVQASLQQVTQGKTLLLISHQLDQLESVDKVLVVEEGQIVQQGPINELTQQGVMQELQLQGERNA